MFDRTTTTMLLNQCSLKYYPNKINGAYKLTYLKKSKREKGWELIEEKKIEDDKQEKINTEKLTNNIIRAKTTIQDYALCNDWEYFITLTLNQEKQDRYDIAQYKKNLVIWLNNYNRINKCKIKYLLIPELHKDGSVHMHGLINGIPSEHLSINNNGYLDWERYKKRFGYVSLSPIKNIDKLSNYVLKYVIKNPAEKGLGKHIYICSQGLQKPVIIKQGELTNMNGLDFDFENDYCGFLTLEDPTEVIDKIREL